MMVVALGIRLLRFTFLYDEFDSFCFTLVVLVGSFVVDFDFVGYALVLGGFWFTWSVFGLVRLSST